MEYACFNININQERESLHKPDQAIRFFVTIEWGFLLSLSNN